MSKESVLITVYGAEQICASCVGAPGSRATYDWLQAALGRKYEEGSIEYEYVDMNTEQTEEKHKAFVDRIFEEDLLYPIIFVNDDMVAEGITRLKTVYNALDEAEVPLSSKE